MSVFLSLHLLQSCGAWTFVCLCVCVRSTHVFLQLVKVIVGKKPILIQPFPLYISRQTCHRENYTFYLPLPPFLLVSSPLSPSASAVTRAFPYFILLPNVSPRLFPSPSLHFCLSLSLPVNFLLIPHKFHVHSPSFSFCLQ